LLEFKVGAAESTARHTAYHKTKINKRLKKNFFNERNKNKNKNFASKKRQK
jgi:hypothetical protein